MKYVVTGGAGFIGSNLVNKLVSQENEVHVIDNFSFGKLDNCHKNAHYHNLDLSEKTNFDQVKDICKNADSVFHLACIARVQPSIENPVKYEMNNTISTVNILKASVDSNVRRFIYSSSSSVYGNQTKLPLKEDFQTNPLSPYGAQKLYGEILCKTFSKVYELETVCLRYFNVYGEKQNIDGAYALVIGIFLNQRSNKKPLTVRGDGSQRRDFTYVGDVVKANILASKSKNVGSGEIINIGNGKNRSINEIASYIGGKIKYIEPVLEPFETLADNLKAKKLLNWEPKQDVKSWIKDYIKKI
ncbi:MAG: NAD-dependent epimerase/dehydratase family protein [Candidatus Neomarinimicrobiota bacterium]